MISIITVSFNSQFTIKQTLESILNQTYSKEFEYIIIDGGSTDGTKDIIFSYEQLLVERGVRFKWISEPDNGIYDAMNKGICMSSGDIIGILNSDDFYEQDTLQNIGECVESEPNIDIYYGYLRVLMSDSNELQVYRYNYENYLGKLGSGCESAAQHPTCFIRRALYDKIGLYNLTYRTAADYDFLLRAKLHGARFKALPVVLTNFRTGGVSSNTSDFEREDQRFRTHFDNGLISEREFRVHLNRQKYRKIKILKSKIFRLFTKTYI